MKIFIVIPAWNEQCSIVHVLRGLKEQYKNIVVVDDGSSDNTYKLAKQEGVFALKHLINRGQGASLKTGMDFALAKGADIIVHFDADGQMRAEEIEKMIEPIMNSKADVTLGSRFLNKKSNMPALKRFFISRPAIVFDRIMSGLKVTDTHNGFRAFSREAAQKIEITLDGFAHASEILAEIADKKIRYQEVPVTIKYHEFGQGFSGGLRTLRDLLFKRLF